MLKRVWGFNALARPDGGGQMRFIAVANDGAVIEDQARSEATIAILGLERLAADHLTPHLRNHVLWRAEEVCRLVAAGDHTAAQAQWARLLSDVTHPEAVLAGATWSALHYLVEPSVRQAAGLVMGPGP